MRCATFACNLLQSLRFIKNKKINDTNSVLKVIISTQMQSNLFTDWKGDTLNKNTNIVWVKINQ